MASEKLDLSKQVDGFSTKLEEFAKNLTDVIKDNELNSSLIHSITVELKANSGGISRLIDMIKENKGSTDEQFSTQSEKFTRIYNVIESNSSNLVKLYYTMKKQGKKLEGHEIVLKEFQQDVHNMKKKVNKLKGVKPENKVELGDEDGEDTLNMADIPKDDIFRYFEFSKTWQDSELIKKWGDSKVVYGVAFNVLPIFQYGQQQEFDYNYMISSGGNIFEDVLVGSVVYNNGAKQLNSKKVLVKPNIRYIFDNPKSIKNSILEVEKFFQLKMTKSYFGIVECINDKSRFPDHINFTPRLSFTDYLSKQTVNGFFLRSNNINMTLVEKNSLLVLKIM
jgi:hypothetical protein